MGATEELATRRLFKVFTGVYVRHDILGTAIFPILFGQKYGTCDISPNNLYEFQLFSVEIS